MNKTELRILQLLTNNGGRMKQREISPQMSRYSAEERNQALGALEALELVSSSQVSRDGKTGGVPGLVFWLTKAGVAHVETLKSEGRIPRSKRGASMHSVSTGYSQAPGPSPRRTSSSPTATSYKQGRSYPQKSGPSTTSLSKGKGSKGRGRACG